MSFPNETDNAKLISIIAKYNETILSNRKLNVLFGNVIAEVIQKHTTETISNVKNEEEANALSLVAMLEIFISLVKSTYNIEKIILDKYKVSKYIVDPLKVDAMIMTDKAFGKIVERENEEKRKKEAIGKDAVGSGMYS